MNGKTLKLTAIIEPDGDYYTALCLELDIASFGKTPNEAFSALLDAVHEYLAYALETGQEELLNRPVPEDISRKYRDLPQGSRRSATAAQQRKFTIPLAPPHAAVSVFAHA